MDNEFIHGVDELNRKLNEAIAYIKTDAKDVIGIEATKHFKQSFENEGFTDKGLQKWAGRKIKSRLNKKILTGEGGGDHLSDSIDYRIEGSNIVIFSDREYAQIHNEGGKITVTPQMSKFFWAQYYIAKEAGEDKLMEYYKYMALAKEITIQQRQFMGESEVLTERIADKIVRDLTAIFNS